MIKDVMFKYIHEQDDIECAIGDEDCLHEGYVDGQQIWYVQDCLP